MCLRFSRIPNDLHSARVTSIFKKGDPAECGNYKPISLLAVGYKIFAVILLNRLKDAGAENRLWSTQFGFKSKHGTVDALFAARRTIEEQWNKKIRFSYSVGFRLG